MNAAIAVTYADERSRIAMDPWTQPFWEGGKEGRLMVGRCGACGTFRMPPLPFCGKCQSQAFEWIHSNARVELYSYTVCTRKGVDGAPPSVYVPAVVEVLDSGRVRLTGNLVGISPAEVRIGMTLQVEWVPIADGWKFPSFRPIAA